MFVINKGVPFVTKRLEDPVAVDRLYELCLSIEPEILKLPRSPEWEGVEGHETTSRYRHYNMFLFEDPLLEDVFALIKGAYSEMLEHTNRPRVPMHIQCWMNIHRQGEGLMPHAHAYPMHGHLTVRAAGTSTVYGKHDDIVVPNENGLLTLLGKPHVSHYVTKHQSTDCARVSIAFDLLPQWLVESDPHWRRTYEERTFIPFD